MLLGILVKFKSPFKKGFMSIFGKKTTKNSPLAEGEYPATMLQMDWKDTKNGDPMLIVEFRTDAGKTGKALFPQTDDFFIKEGMNACEILLGIAEPDDFETFFHLANQKASRSRFKLVVKNYKKKSGEITQNLLIKKLHSQQKEKEFEPAWSVGREV